MTSDLGCQIEFRVGHHYAAIGLPPRADASAVVAVLARLANVGALAWEWADPATSEAG
jgi:hypothetical protein